MKDGLSKSCEKACSCAIIKFNSVSSQLQTGEISCLDMHEVNKSLPAMKQLCEAAEEKEKKTKKKSEDSSLFNTLREAIKCRLQEYKVFIKQRDCVLRLCYQCKNIKGKTFLNFQILFNTMHMHVDIEEATTELNRNYDSYSINALCRRTDSNFKVVCFTSAAPLLSFAWKFDIMTKTNSNIFYTIWHDAAQSCSPNITISDIEEQIWNPAFKQCCTLLDELYNKSMTLSDVDRYFSRKPTEELELELKALSSGMNMCLGKTYTENDNWISRCMSLVVEYRKLHEYSVAAKTFLELKDTLNLTSDDFGEVQMISAKVCFKKFNLLRFIHNTIGIIINER